VSNFKEESDLLIYFDTHRDIRGDLVALNFDLSLPFVPLRYFSTFNVPVASTRGGHAHRTCKQLLIASSGTVEVTLFKSDGSTTYLLDSPGMGLYIPPMTWGVQHDHSPNMVLSVFASEKYDPTEYIRNFQEYELLSRSK